MKGFPDSLRTTYKMTEFEQKIVDFLITRGFVFYMDVYLTCFKFQKKLDEDVIIKGVFYSETIPNIPNYNPYFLTQILVNGHKISEKEAGFSSGEDILKLVDDTCKDAEKFLENLQVRLAQYRLTGM